ncbi:PH domain-containing protein [Nocardia wallacei]|uniref:PH domain-containing protein n=1 Tax=Nocardia wallacei TaxID=480035 RepID=UPI00245848EB|nr:PH domain-containing protein [Nocardia wallacei]
MTEPPPASWQRLDKRMLLVHPVREIVRYIPLLIVSVVVGTRNDNPGWGLLALVVIVGFAVARWFTTTYRIGADNVELRTGVVQRKRLAVPRSRIRSVDIEADPLHRGLGLAVLTIGTGQQVGKDEQFKLDALDARLVPGLRAELLAHLNKMEDVGAQHGSLTGEPAAGSPDTPAPAPGETDAHREGIEIAHWQPRWVRYAPLSLTGFAIVAPVVGLAFQYGLAEAIFRSDAVHSVEGRGAWFLTAVVVALVAAVAAIVSLAGCARYLATYFGLRVLDDGRTLHLRHGLFTTRQTTLDLARLRGATVNEPLLLRLAGGAELEAIMTGTSPRQKILPQAPRAAVDRTLGHLLASRTARRSLTAATQSDPASATTEAATSADITASAAPATISLNPHGPRARQRRYTRALTPVLVAAIAVVAISVAGVDVPLWMWLVLALIALAATALAYDRYRGLGHAVLPAAGDRPTWLITRSGSLDRDRDCLEAPGIIGWTLRQTFFQRRAGVATLVAASAAGKKRYHVVDIPVDQAWALIERVTPGQLGHR